MGAIEAAASVLGEPGMRPEVQTDDEALIQMQTEAHYHNYSQYTSASNLPQKPSEDEVKIEAQVQDLLEKVLR